MPCLHSKHLGIFFGGGGVWEVLVYSRSTWVIGNLDADICIWKTSLAPLRPTEQSGCVQPCVLPVFGCRYRDWSSPSAVQPCPDNHNPLSRLSAVSLHWQYSDHQIQAFALGPETVLSFCFSWYIRMQSEHFLMPNLLNTATRMYSLLFLYYAQQFKSTVPRNSCIKYWYSFCSGFLLHGVRVTEEIQLCERLPPSHHSHSDAFYLFFRQHLSLLVRPSSWCPSFPDSWKIVSYLHILKQSALYLMSFLMHGLSRSGTPR